MNNWFKSVFLIVALFLPVFLLSLPLKSETLAAEFVDGQKILAPDGEMGANYGSSVAISGDTAIVGARHAEGPAADSGAAYVYERDAGGNWVFIQKLTASDAQSGDFFGASVAIDGRTCVVGSVFSNGQEADSGAAYVFHLNNAGTWVQTDKLTAEDGETSDLFGISVSISGDKIIVGAQGDDDNGEDAGAAYIFERGVFGVWQFSAKLDALDAMPGDAFGLSVGISGRTAMVGARFSDSLLDTVSGAVYVFYKDDLNRWRHIQKLFPYDVEFNDSFGFSLAIDGDKAIVGAIFEDEKGISSGSAYIFEINSFGFWGEVDKISSDDGVIGDLFGFSVSISGPKAVAGVRFGDGIADNTGSAYVYLRDESGKWNQVDKLEATDGGDNDAFGVSVSISGDRVIIGAQFDDDDGDDSGSAYIFEQMPLILNPVTPGHFGTTNSISSEQATPEGEVAFYWGFKSGSSKLKTQTCSGLDLDIKNPRLLAIVNSSSDGLAEHTFWIPLLNYVEIAVVTQAVDVNTCRKSETVLNIIRKE